MERKRSSQGIRMRGDEMKQTQTAAFGIPEYELQRSEVYRPRISFKRMRRLRIIRKQSGKPITRLVAEALDKYFEITERG